MAIRLKTIAAAAEGEKGTFQGGVRGLAGSHGAIGRSCLGANANAQLINKLFCQCLQNVTPGMHRKRLSHNSEPNSVMVDGAC